MQNQIATPQQVVQALRNLKMDEHRMLLRGARRHLRGTSFTEPADLLNQTIDQLLVAKRHWPLHMAFGPFMQITMKSVADANAKRVAHLPSRRVSIDSLEGFESQHRLTVPSVEELQSSKERAWLAIETARSARASLEGDRGAQSIIDAMRLELDRAEACQTFGLRQDEFDAARKRAVRALKRCALPRFGSAAMAAARRPPGEFHA